MLTYKYTSIHTYKHARKHDNLKLIKYFNRDMGLRVLETMLIRHGHFRSFADGFFLLPLLSILWWQVSVACK